jgi:hypothetical protein
LAIIAVATVLFPLVVAVLKIVVDVVAMESVP